MQGKKVLLVIIALGLAFIPASFAQDMGEFQKQMMQQMMQQNMQKFQGGEAGQQGFPSIDKDKTTTTQGKALFNDSSLGSNGKSCGSCHQEGEKPLDGRDINHHLVAYVQYCYEHALGGEKVIGQAKLDKIMSYFVSLKMTKSAPQPQAPQQHEESL